MISQNGILKNWSCEVIKPPAATDNSLAPILNYVGDKTRVKFDGCCLKQDKITHTHGLIVHIYIVYKFQLLLILILP